MNISGSRQVTAKTLQVMGFYNIFYNMSNFSFEVNFPFKIRDKLCSDRD